MSISNSKKYHMKTFSVGELQRALNEVASIVGPDITIDKLYLQERLADGSLSTNSYDDLQHLEKVCDLSAFYVRVEYSRRNGSGFNVIIQTHFGWLGVDVGADVAITITKAFDYLEITLGLEPYVEKEDQSKAQEPSVSLEELATRIQLLEAKFSAPRELRCFLSYRFTPSNELLAARIQHFIDLLGIRVTSGASYEPRRVTEKVMSKLEGPLDFIVVLITDDGESYWTRDETSTAIHRQIPLIPIVQEGSKFASGLFGDLEYIEFSKGHIGDAFLKLLEALTFVRSEIQRMNSQAEESVK